MENIRTRVGEVTITTITMLSVLGSSALGAVHEDEDGQRGQGLAEYALILAFIAIACITALVFFGEQLVSLFWDPINSEISGVGNRI